jgi:hypothetical protein
MATFEMGKEIIPIVSIDRVLLESGDADGETSVWLDMSIQDTLDNDNTSWFFQEDFIDYLKIKVILSHTAEDTEMILTEDLSTILGSRILEDKQTIDISANLKKFQNIVNSNGNVIKDLSFVDDPIISSDGTLIYRIPIKYNFKTNVQDHFSIFVYTFLDLQEISGDFGLNVPAGTFADYTYGEISGETVLNESKIISSSAVFFTTDDKGIQTVWTGPVKLNTAGKYYAPNTNPEKILQKTLIPNYKVQDLRSSRISVSPPVITEATEQFKAVQKRLLNNTTLNFGINTANYCSQGMKSSDKGGIITLYFDLDFQNLVEYNSLFGSLMSGPSKNDVLENSRITEFKIYRRRVKHRLSNSRLGTTIDDIYEFDQNQPWEMIAISGEPKNKRFLTESKYYGNVPKESEVEQNLIGSVKEIYRGLFEDASIRTFEIKDYSLRDKTFGLYQYGVEMKMEDGTVMFLQNVLNDLSNAIRALTNYYTIATSIKFYNPQTRKFKDDLLEFYQALDETPWATAISTYIDVLSELVYRPKDTDPQSVDFDPLAPPELLSEAEKTNLSLELNNLANPNGGTPEGVAALLSLLENLEDLILKTLQGKVRFLNQQVDSGQSEIYHKNNYDRFVISYSHFLKSYIDSDFPDGTGISVLPTESPTLFLNKFKTRAEEESLKYFKYKNPEEITKNIGKVPGLNQENAGIADVRESFYTYFSPMKISVGGQALELQNKGNSVWDNSTYERFTTFLLQTGAGPKMTTPDNSVSKTGNPKVSSKNSDKAPTLGTVQLLENMLSEYSVTVSTTLEENKATAETIKSVPPDSSMSFNQSSARKENKIYDDFLIKNVEDVGRIFTSLAISNKAGQNAEIRNKNRQPTTKPTIKSYNLATNENLIDNSVRKSAIKKGQLEKLPNQISSLFLSQSPAVKNNWQNYEKEGIDFISSNQTDLMFLYNYSSLFKIMFQEGYQKDKNGKPLLNQPIWKEMTEKALKRVERSEILLCKVEKYNNAEVGVQFPELLDLPIFDQHFILAKDASTLNSAKRPPRKRRKKSRFKDTLKNANNTADFEVSAFSKGLVRKNK